MKKYFSKSILISSTLAILLSAIVCFAQGEKIKAKILIEVTPNTIALPGNPAISRAPIGACRVRSTALRELNEYYGAVSIEKLYQIKEKPKEALPKRPKVITPKDLKDRLVNKEEAKEEKKPVGLTNLYEQDKAGEIAGEEEEVVLAQDKFIIYFESDPEKGIDMQKLLSDYKTLDVVINAEIR